MKSRQILILVAAVALVAAVGFRFGPLAGGDDAEPPFTPPAVAATEGADDGSRGTTSAATPPAAPAGTGAGGSSGADAGADEDRGEQTSDFPARFQKRVDRMCARAEQRSRAIERKGVKTIDDVHAVVVVLEDLATDFETTKAPARNRRAWRSYTRLVRDASNAVGRVEIEAADGDVPAVRALGPELKRFDRRLTRQSARYGFGECADD